MGSRPLPSRGQALDARKRRRGWAVRGAGPRGGGEDGSRMREDRRGGITPIQTLPRRGGRVKRGGGEDGFPPPAFAGASSRREEKEEGVGGSRSRPKGSGMKMGSRIREDRRGGITPIQTFPRRGGRVKRRGGEDGFPPPAFAGASSRREDTGRRGWGRAV